MAYGFDHLNRALGKSPKKLNATAKADFLLRLRSNVICRSKKYWRNHSTESIQNIKEDSNRNFDVSSLQWARKPQSSVIAGDRIEIVTQPHTDLWQPIIIFEMTTPRCCK